MLFWNGKEFVNLGAISGAPKDHTIYNPLGPSERLPMWSAYRHTLREWLDLPGPQRFEPSHFSWDCFQYRRLCGFPKSMGV